MVSVLVSGDTNLLLWLSDAHLASGGPRAELAITGSGNIEGLPPPSLPVRRKPISQIEFGFVIFIIPGLPPLVDFFINPQ